MTAEVPVDGQSASLGITRRAALSDVRPSIVSDGGICSMIKQRHFSFLSESTIILDIHTLKMPRSSKMKTDRSVDTVPPTPSRSPVARRSLIVRLRYRPRTVSIRLGPPRRPEHLLDKEHCSKEMANLRGAILGWTLGPCGPMGILVAVALRQPLPTSDPAKEVLVQRLKEAFRCPRCTWCLNSGDESLNMATVWGYFGSELVDNITDQVRRMVGV
ncbi:hypothetical protein BZA77DRAFT_290373 [Pyronema omphalodes]|nr:hypothetical protein BZA77DRAFT_290372 [Pyronema omphalodes]KAI5819674.1 hypothetical protein BZA77DRAFT_290373 [Pyronema omphalodes]